MHALRFSSAARKRHPRHWFLVDLYDGQAGPLEALLRLGALHGGSRTLGFRDGFVGSEGRYFPHPADVGPLLEVLFQRLLSNFLSCTAVADDLVNAALAAYGVLAIHPFENGNGRSATDFAQYLLMIRWRHRQPPLALSDDAHRVMGQAFVPLDEPNTGASGQEFVHLREGLRERLAHADLGMLRREPAFVLVAKWFGVGLESLGGMNARSQSQ